MLPPTFEIMLETLAYDPMMLPLLSPIMKDDTTLPRTLICPLAATLPPRNTTLPMLPPTFAIMLETLAYDPMMLPLLSPIMKDDTTLPRTLICPLAATLPPRNTTLPMLPPTFEIMLETLAYEPMMFPRTSVEAIAGRVDVIPVSPLPSPTKNPALTYADVVTFPSTVKRTLAMLPPTFAIMLDTLAYDPMMLPRTSMDAIAAGVEVMPVSPLPSPTKNPAFMYADVVTFPSTVKRTLAMLPPTFAIIFETLAYDPMMLPRTSMEAIAAGVEVIPVSPLPSPTKNPALTYADVVTFPSIVKRTLAMLPPTFEIMLETFAYDPMMLPLLSPIMKDDTTLPRTLICPLAAILPPRNTTLPMLPPTFEIMLETLAYEPMMLPLLSPIMKDDTTLPRTLICPLAATLPPRNTTLPMLPPTFEIMLETFAYEPMMLPLLSPIMKDDTTLPRTLICPLAATLPPRNTTLPMLPPTFEIMLETLAYDPMMLPLLSPIMKDDTTLPRTLICPLAATLPPRNTTLPMLPPTLEIMLETFAYDPMMLPRTSVEAIAGRVDVIPVSPLPSPTKNPALTYADVVTFPSTVKRTLAMLPPTFAIMLETFAYDPMILPRTSVVEIAAGVEVMPVSPLPSPTKNPALTYADVVTFPSTVKRTLAMLPPTFAIIFETLAYDPMMLPRMSDDETDGGVKVAPVRKAPFPTKYCSVIMFPEAYISSKLLFHGVRK
ncbi:hypothetical protein FR483_n156L [Paramecium bursaria Chlorella virus FR483]|uniref:Uncharacterized protein n156L n=1 Tax=Paramecium bursaria Chlorella virus FR483 TaxID=399781 RepID=A7J6L0_PBCVF|nr:hypothetical protein FR483_n156L [Paramecium bursaria Chlorella virus FR483]ABT15441.1 hypothetical protein FR483_n156L [Paramecium bursaria Chlorella virus FR483]